MTSSMILFNLSVTLEIINNFFSSKKDLERIPLKKSELLSMISFSSYL